jgi:hypothetical protein
MDELKSKSESKEYIISKICSIEIKLKELYKLKKYKYL